MKISDIVIYLFQLVAIVMLATAAYPKLVGAEAMVSLFTSLHMEPFGRYFIGLIELLAVILLLLPKWAATGALLGGSVTFIALIVHTTGLGMNTGFFLAAVIFVCCSVVMWARRKHLPFFGETLE